MRAFRIPALLLGLTLSLGACHDATGPLPQDDVLQRVLYAHGFNPGYVVDRGDHYLVEGDIALSKSLVARWISEASRAPDQPAPGQRPRFQWRTDTLVSQQSVRNIVVSISMLAAQWQSAATDAIAQWNGLQSGVQITVGSPADITFSMDNLGQNVIAAASFPDDGPDGKPGPTIRVNNSQPPSSDNPAVRLHNMVHEIGHTLGFRHTNWQHYECPPPFIIEEEEGEEGAVQIPGTPPTDANSVMNGCTGNHAWSGFSSYDRIAVHTLYPPPPPPLSVWISGLGSVCDTGYYVWEAMPSGGTGEYEYQWEEYVMGGMITWGNEKTQGLYLDPQDGDIQLRVIVTSGSEVQDAWQYVYNTGDC